MEAAPQPWPALGVLLMREGIVEKDELEEILTQQLDARQRRLSGRRLGEILVQRGKVTPAQIARLVAEQYELPFVDFDVADIDARAARLISEDDARRFSAIPISRRADGTYLLAIADPSTVLFSDELRRMLGSSPRFVVVGPGAIEAAIDAVFGSSTQPEPYGAFEAEPEIEADPDREAVLLAFPATSGSAFELLESRIADASAAQTSPLLGALLLRDGLLTSADLDAALAQQRISPSHRLGEILVDKGLVTPAVVARLVAEQYELPFVELGTLHVDSAAALLLPEEVARRLSAVPIARQEDGTLEVAIADPTQALSSDELLDALQGRLAFVVASPDSVDVVLDRVHAPSPEAVEVEAVVTETVVVEAVEVEVEVMEVEAVEIEAAEAAPMADPEPMVVEAAADEQALADATEMPSVAFVLDAFAQPWEDEPALLAEPEAVANADAEPDPVAEAYPEPDVEADAHLEPDPEADAELEPVAEAAAEPESLDVVLDADTFGAVDELTTDDEPARESHLEFVEVEEDEEVEASLEEPDFVLTWPQTPEIPAAAETADEPSAEDEPQVEDVVTLDHASATDEDKAEVVETAEWAPDETEAVEVDTYEFSWPTAADPFEPDDEPTAEDELEPQIAETDVVEAAPPEQPEAAVSAEAVVLDIFRIASQPTSEPVESHDVPRAEEDFAPPAAPMDEVVGDPATAFVPAPLAYFPLHTERFSGGAAHFDPELAVVDDLIEAEAVVEAEPKVEDEAGTDFDAVVEDALAAGASALHFSPQGDGLAVRARVDGFVRDLGTASLEERDTLVARLEAAGVARTHVVMTSRGAKTTLFVRERTGSPASIEDLGVGVDKAATLRAALGRPSGTILVCGPAGSGTTTTLYAMLETLATPDRVVTTIEHPVERMVDGADQIEVDAASGMTFASVLGELRFADTDAVVVGELVDREAAGLALRAAYDGRLVVAGFRAPGAAAAIRRLADLGIDPTVLSTSIACVVSQRLVRTTCTECRETYYASEEELMALGQPETGSPRLLARGTGCSSCDGSGYRGRTGIFELLPVTDEIRELVVEGASAKKIQKAAVAAGMRTLRDEGNRLCLDGMTTVAEIARVLRDDS